MKRVLLSYLIFALTLGLFSSCKNEKGTPKKDSGEKEIVETDPNFYVSVLMKSSTQETIRLFYVNLGDESYSEEHSLKLTLNPSETYQEVKFKMEEIPEKFRIDFGDSENDGSMEIDRVVLENEGKMISVGFEVLDRYFKPNIYMEVDGSLVNRKTIDGRYDPFMESRDLLHQQILIDFIQ